MIKDFKKEITIDSDGDVLHFDVEPSSKSGIRSEEEEEKGVSLATQDSQYHLWCHGSHGTYRSDGWISLETSITFLYG